MKLLLFLFLSFSLFAEEEIVVHLASQESMVPIYLAPIEHKESGLDKAYLTALEKVIRFDFDHNGKTEMSSSEKEASRLDIAIRKKVLKAELKLSRLGKVKAVEGVALSGDISKDRVLLHQIHDTLFSSLFHTAGIAQSRILYTVKNKKSGEGLDWGSDVWEADYDGGNAHQLTHEGSLCVTPTFLPNKEGGRCSNFLYVSYKVGQPKIYAATFEQSVGKRLTFLKGNQLMPALSPTLDKIAFISDVTGNPDLFVQDFSAEKGLLGKPRQVFSAPGAAQGTPTFSPDGKKIAFVSNKDGTPRIYILDIPPPGASIKTVQPKMISKKTRENTCPAWSPDGKKIAYSALSAGTRQIWVYDLTTGVERQLTEGYGHKENPAWAPNSQHLVFNSSTPSSSDLFMINLNQKKAVKITSGPGEKRFPAWEPLQLERKKV